MLLRSFVSVSIFVSAVTGIAAGEDLSILMPVQDEWELQFKDVAQFSDGSYGIVMGMVMEDLAVLRISPAGVSRSGYRFSVPGRALESGGWILPTGDNGCFAVAYSEPRATGVDSDIAIVKLAEDFTEEWTVVIGEDTDEVFSCYGAAKTASGGIAVLGDTGYQGDSPFVRAYTPEGEFDWEYCPDPEDEYLPLTIGSTEDGVILLSSHQWTDKTYLQKIDGNGSLQWVCEVPIASLSRQAAVEESEEGFVAYFSDRENDRSAVVVVADEAGSLTGTGRFTHGMLVQDVLIHEGSSVLLTGSRIIDGETSAVLEAYDLNGNLLWKRRLEGGQNEEFTAVCRDNGGGYALFGYSFSEEDSDDSNALLIVTGADGVVEGGANPSQIPMPVQEIQIH